ncbi:16S rRNA (cytosine(1402)-N(4))-methyltransferase RsmH [Caenibacillus caldisaponilyticus]|uniref:16S rRNA (cytosine(1402)-N(4))-methyltransferase RsmH n=1 Tax=Caenibacillus caldisaponilyticus TaxID=1674942 RepID=UPI0009884BF5|nr:16S rRNA (cytosine(1402)-N(4))-methyltransferase RsmH [Caenibacillus caldisaponilyticus]
MFEHESVLKNEAIEALNIKPDGVYVDCTLGGGGHSEAILERLTTGRLYAFDQDPEARRAAAERLKPFQERLTIIPRNFRHLREELNARGVDRVDGVLYDLGVSSPQFDRSERGFSYRFDGPLDMRMNPDAPLTAADIVNEWPYEKLVSIFFKYGEERFSKAIARKIEAVRAKERIASTGALVEIIKDAIPHAARRKGGHPAKRVFQALRIAVNDELTAFEESLEQAIAMASAGGRIVAITFHSLEDRICKQIFNKYSKGPDIPPGMPAPPDFHPVLRLVNKKPILPTEEELKRNHRAHSAKLRAAEKLRTNEEER